GRALNGTSRGPPARRPRAPPDGASRAVSRDYDADSLRVLFRQLETAAARGRNAPSPLRRLLAIRTGGAPEERSPAFGDRKTRPASRKSRGGDRGLRNRNCPGHEAPSSPGDRLLRPGRDSARRKSACGRRQTERRHVSETAG